MGQILDAKGDPIASREALARVVHWARRTKTFAIAIGAFAGALALFLGNVKSIHDAFGLKSTSTLDYVSEIPPAEFPNLVSGGEGPLELAGVIFHRERRVLDLRVRNTTDDQVIINQIAFSVRYDRNAGASLSASGSHDLKISRADLGRKKAAKEPFKLRKGFNVAYVVSPHGADRYIFKLDLTERDLYVPNSAYRGSYRISIYFRANKNEFARDFDLMSLLEGGTGQSNAVISPNTAAQPGRATH